MMQLDIEAINVDVREKEAASPEPRSTKAKGKTLVPKLDLAMGAKKQAPETPRSSSRRETTQEDVRLPTMHEEDYEHDPMNVGHMATTNVSHDSATKQEADKNFKEMLAQEADNDGENQQHRKEPDSAPIDDQEEEKKDHGTLTKQASAGSARGANMVIEDSNRNTAIELFENYFARAYKRRDNAPMHEKRFMRVIDRVKNRENLDDVYIAQFRSLFSDAKKDAEGRLSAEALIDAIVAMLEKQNAEMQEEEEQEKKRKKQSSSSPSG